jgi:hypothetical protein
VEVFYVSYYLKDKAADFYNQVVVPEEENYDLEKFFIGLFDFIFPPDFRNTQRKKLNRCFQNEKTVTAHVAEFAQIYSTIGLKHDQEKVVKVWNSFRGEIQQEMYRQNLDPEISSWEAVINGAEHAEVLLKLSKGKGPSPSAKQEGNSNQRNRDQPVRGAFRGRGQSGNISCPVRIYVVL